MTRSNTHFRDGDEALCHTSVKKLTKYPKLVTCELCKKLMPTDTLKMPTKSRSDYFRANLLGEKVRNEIYAHWLKGKNNTHPEIAVKFGVTCA